MKSLQLLLIFALSTCLLLLCSVVTGEKILFFLPIATKSHKNVFDPLVKALADKGHKITVVSPANYPKPNPNIREIVPLAYDQLWQEFDALEIRRKGARISMLSSSAFDFVFRACEVIFENKEFQGLVNEKFDLIFYNGFVNNCFDGMLYKLQAPFISVTTQAAPSSITEYAGLYLPTSFVPGNLMPFSDDMNFYQRSINWIVMYLFKIMGHFSYTPKCEKIYRKYLGDDCPSMRDIMSNVSMIFMNSHHSLTYPRPNLPDTIEVGGMHCRPAQPLPKDLEDFISGAEHGVILFSLGSIVNTDQLPDEMRQKFLNVFSRLKQRVIWKWNSEKMDGQVIPANLILRKWLPQQDILGHPKVRVFMTHGGLLSTQEAAYHGVTLLGIPVFADQDLNMKQAEEAGYALTMEILDFTEEKLEDLLNKLLHDPQYYTKAKQLSSVFRDQQETPIERGVYWAEYVMRYRGQLNHLHSAARKLNFFQYHSLDVIAFLFAILLVTISVLVFLVKWCFRKIFRSKSLHATTPTVSNNNEKKKN